MPGGSPMTQETSVFFSHGYSDLQTWWKPGRQRCKTHCKAQGRVGLHWVMSTKCQRYSERHLGPHGTPHLLAVGGQHRNVHAMVSGVGHALRQQLPGAIACDHRLRERAVVCAVRALPCTRAARCRTPPARHPARPGCGNEKARAMSENVQRVQWLADSLPRYAPDLLELKPQR